MSIARIDPPIWMNTPRGDALAHFVIDYGPEADLIWVCFGSADGQIWCWPNQKVRACRNVTMGRERPERVDDQWSAGDLQVMVSGDPLDVNIIKGS